MARARQRPARSPARSCSSSLEGLPLDVTLHETTSGIAALLDGGKPGPTVLLRGDMDALPMPEDTGLDFPSKVDDCDARLRPRHAHGDAGRCGQAAQRAADADLPGRVLFMFQPGEEGFGGAEFMLDEGLLDVPPLADGTPSPVTGAFALHISTNLPSRMDRHQGRARSWRRPTRCSSRSPAAAATPASRTRALDPIPVACEIVQALQTMVTRTIDVFDPSVVTVGRITAGTTNNVIPETADIEGTIRAVSERTRAKVHDGIRRVAEGVAAAHDAQIDVQFHDGYPVTVNNPGSADFSLDVAREVLGDRQVVRHAQPGDGRRGLQLRARTGARLDDVPRRHAAGPRPVEGRAEPLEPRRTSTRTPWSTAWPSTPPWPSATSLRHP